MFAVAMKICIWTEVFDESDDIFKLKKVIITFFHIKLLFNSNMSL